MAVAWGNARATPPGNHRIAALQAAPITPRPWCASIYNGRFPGSPGRANHERDLNPRGPIGVFDSGVGGLTVVRALMERLPFESIHYFGDTARVPYGIKSVQTISHYTTQIAEFLLEKR
jgi:hypothetical protein